MRILTLAAVAALVLATLTACPADLRTNPGDPCPSAGAKQEIDTYPNGHPTLVCTKTGDGKQVWK